MTGPVQVKRSFFRCSWPSFASFAKLNRPGPTSNVKCGTHTFFLLTLDDYEAVGKSTGSFSFFPISDTSLSTPSLKANRPSSSPEQKRGKEGVGVWGRGKLGLLVPPPPNQHHAADISPALLVRRWVALDYASCGAAAGRPGLSWRQAGT